MERILRGFWEAKILDFRTFVDDFSKSFLARESKGAKIEKSCQQESSDDFLEGGRCHGGTALAKPRREYGRSP